MAQRSLIKEYGPRRKIYGVFSFIDSVRCTLREVLVANRHYLQFGMLLRETS